MKAAYKSSKKRFTATITGESWQINLLQRKIKNMQFADRCVHPTMRIRR